MSHGERFLLVGSYFIKKDSFAYWKWRKLMGRGQLQDWSLRRRTGMGHTTQQKEHAMDRGWQGGQWGTGSGILTLPGEKRKCFGHRCMDIGKTLVDLACEHIEIFLQFLNWILSIIHSARHAVGVQKIYWMDLYTLLTYSREFPKNNALYRSSSGFERKPALSNSVRGKERSFSNKL